MIRISEYRVGQVVKVECNKYVPGFYSKDEIYEGVPAKPLFFRVIGKSRDRIVVKSVSCDEKLKISKKWITDFNNHWYIERFKISVAKKKELALEML